MSFQTTSSKTGNHGELSGDRKSSITDGWKAGAANDKRWWRCRAETPMGLDVRRPMGKIVSEERRGRKWFGWASCHRVIAQHLGLLIYYARKAAIVYW